ncbi:MAG: hypothetical protein IPM69_04425 [Ignavibacteria bacterium]|nr:hypothetical protein [Ignavibacteria bacterium]
MNSIVIVVLCSMLTYQEVREDFYNFVLDDNELFVVVDVKTKSYTKPSVIQNWYLKKYYYQTEAYNDLTYAETIIEKFTHHLPIELNDSILKKHPTIRFRIIPQVESVDSNAKKGKDEFISIYFNRGDVIKPVTYEEQLAIIQKLFEWNLATYIDDETGALIIARRKYFKK